MVGSGSGMLVNLVGEGQLSFQNYSKPSSRVLFKIKYFLGLHITKVIRIYIERNLLETGQLLGA